jgi:hypothetical protein
MIAPSPHRRKHADALTETAGFDATERQPRPAAGRADPLALSLTGALNDHAANCCFARLAAAWRCT